MPIIFLMGQKEAKPARHRVNGRDMTDEEYAAWSQEREEKLLAAGAAILQGDGVPDVPSKSGWPATSEALGGHPDQRAELMRMYEHLGVPTEINECGQAVFTSQRHKDAAMKARGMVDRGRRIITMPKGHNHDEYNGPR